MRTARRLAVALLAAAAVLPTAARAGDARAGDAPPPAGQPAAGQPTTIWNLGPYITGTTEQVRDLINGPVELLMNKRADRARQLDAAKAADEARTAALADHLKQASPPFAAAEAELASAAAAATAARAGGDATARIAAGGRQRAAAAEVKRQLDAAAAADPAAAAGRKQVADLTQQVAALHPAVANAMAGRDRTLDGFRTSLALPGPPKVGNKGLLMKVKPVKIIDAHSFLGDYVAIEKLGEDKGAKVADGMKAFTGRGYRVHVLVTGTDTAKLKEHEETNLDHAYAFTGTRAVGRTPCFVAEPVDGGPADALFAALDDLRVPAPPGK